MGSDEEARPAANEGSLAERVTYRIDLHHGNVATLEVALHREGVRMSIYHREIAEQPMVNARLGYLDCAALIVALGGCLGWQEEVLQALRGGEDRSRT